MDRKIDSRFAEAQKSIVMDSSSSKAALRQSVWLLGQEMGKKVIEDYFLSKGTLQTPMNVQVERIVPTVPLCAIVTTRDDFEFLGKGISSVLYNSIAGYMDFEGRRGLQALNAQIQHVELLEPKGQHVHTLIVAKAILATGCTAIHLTRSAMSKYMPRQIIISSIFFSEHAVAELHHEIPNADIIVIGSPDSLDEDGMLVPGVGILDQRLKD